MSDTKRALRSELIAARARMTQDERRIASLAIAGRVEELPAFRAARLVALYAPLGTEVDASEIARRAGQKDGQDVADPAMFNALVQRARLRIDTEKWAASKLDAKTYGDKLQHEHSGSISVTVATGVPELGALPAARLLDEDEGGGQGVLGYSIGSSVSSLRRTPTTAMSPPPMAARMASPRPSPARRMGTTIGSGSSVDRNPDANQAFLDSGQRAFTCSPAEPIGSVTLGTKKAARISCYSSGSEHGPDTGAGAVLASVTLNVVGPPGVGSVLALKNVNVFDHHNEESASCNPTVSVTATCYGATVTSADFGVAAYGSGDEIVRIHRITAPWSEDAVTWNSFAASYDADVEADLTWIGPYDMSADLTGLVQAWVDGTAPNHGFLVEEEPTGRTSYRSSDHPLQEDRPWLEVCYFAP